MPRLFITGADGFTGVHLCELAKRSSYSIFESKAPLSNTLLLTEELEKSQPEFVIHLAAISSTVSENPNEIYETNLIGTLNLLNILSNLPSKPSKVLLASSAQVYGNQIQAQFSEGDVTSPYNHYGISKLSMELVAQQFFNILPIVLLRPFNYTGVGHNEHFVIPKIVQHFKKKSLSIELGNIDTEREYNDVRTICKIYLDLLLKGVSSETYNICSGKTHSLREIISTLEKMSSYQINVQQNPKLIRAREPQSLSGNPEKLQLALGVIDFIPLEETLKWMLVS
jgi:nucleoside-diphosphate-sugar epimerase